MLYSSKEIRKVKALSKLQAESAPLASTGVYRIIAPSGKIYVGMTTVAFRERWRNHLRALAKGSHISLHLQQSATKHGIESLVFEILEVVTDATIYRKEQAHWDRLKADGAILFNGRPSGDGKGVHPTEEQNLKRAESLRKLAVARLQAKTGITEAATRQRYLETGLSAEAIGKEFGLSKKQIYRLMAYWSIPTRSSAEARPASYSKKECSSCGDFFASTMLERHTRKCRALPACSECGRRLVTRKAVKCWPCFSGTDHQSNRTYRES